MVTSCIVVIVVITFLLQLLLLGSADETGVLSDQLQRDAKAVGSSRLPPYDTNDRQARSVLLYTVSLLHSPLRPSQSDTLKFLS